MEKAIISFLFVMIFGFIAMYLFICYGGWIGQVIGFVFVIALATARITYVIDSKKEETRKEE